MKLNKGWVVIVTIAISIYILGTAVAQDESVPGPSATQETVDQQTEIDQEGPSLSSPTAAQRAENLAEATANKAQAEISDTQQNVTEAEAALDEAKKSGDQAAIDEAQANYDAAVQSLDEAVANSTGITADEITAMRSSGMGWGQIAHELGVHPGSLGLGHTKGKKANEMEMATTRNTKNRT